MTYEEIKTRLTQCETKLQGLKQTKPTSGNVANYNLAVQKLEVLKESLSKKLSEAEKTAFVNGQATEYEDEKELNKLKDNPDVKSIKTASGKKIKEQQGVNFSVEETSAIAKKTGKAVAMGLKALGDEVAHMKARNIEENSFEIYVEYKNGAEDQFSFYIPDDTLHLVDFSFNKELVDVGVKPSGEAIVNVDVLSNELVKHWKSMKEGMSDQEFADAQENDRLNKHPEKDTIKKIQALIAAQRKDESIFDTPSMGGFHNSKGVAGHISNTHKQDKEYADYYRKAFKKDDKQINEVPKGMFYIEVSIRDARKALAIIDDQPALKHAVQIDDSNRYYLTDEELAYDLMMDFNAHDVEVVDNNIELDEASDYARRRAAERDYQPSKRDVPPKKYKEPSNDYFARRKKESDYNEDVDAQQDGGDLDVGHQDDEPDMLMKDIYDIATYAAKLHKMLKKYNDFDGEVDFPHWWQKKVTLARDYISAAQHYLEAEEKQPALDQLALEGREKGNKVIKEDWGGSDQAAMNQAIHKALGEPKKMPSPFDSNLEFAVQDEVDFHWDEWPEYQTDREGLYANAKRAYLRAYFRDTFDKMVRMFEPADEATEKEEEKFHKNLDTLVHKTFGKRKEELEEGTDLYDRNGISIKRFFGGQDKGVMVQITIGGKYITVSASEYPFLVRAMQSVQDDLKDMARQMPRAKNMNEESVAKVQKAHDLVVNKMKELAKVYKSGDTSVIAQLKDLTAKKKKLEKQLEKAVAGTNRNQQLDASGLDENLDRYLESAVRDLVDSHAATAGLTDQVAAEEMMEFIGQEYGVDFEFGAGPSRQVEQTIKEEKATCCGKCGRVHVKGTKCKTPYLKGKDHCRYN